MIRSILEATVYNLQIEIVAVLATVIIIVSCNILITDIKKVQKGAE